MTRLLLVADTDDVWDDVARLVDARYTVERCSAADLDAPTGPVHVAAHGREAVRAVLAGAARFASVTLVTGRRPPEPPVPAQWIRPTGGVPAWTGQGGGRLWQRSLVSAAADPWARPEALACMITELVDHTEGVAEPAAALRMREGARLAFVTGAASGIGRATALAFAQSGCDIAAADLDEDGARRTAAEAAYCGVSAAAYRVDVASPEQTAVVAERVIAEQGTPDIVMANAGIAVVGGFLDTGEDDWRRAIDVNLWGAVNTMRAFTPVLVRRGEGGHLVITSSMAGYFPARGQAAYATTKAGALMLARSLSAELAEHGIGVTALCPGFVRTNIATSARFAGADPDRAATRRREAQEAARRRAHPPEKVAAAVVDAVRGNRALVPATPESRVVAALNRVTPDLVTALARRVDLS